MITRYLKTPFLILTRNFSNKNIVIEINNKTNIAILSLNRPPVNCLNLELLNELHSSLGNLEKEKVNGVIITSNKAGVLSGGLDILELQTTDQKKIKKYWVTFRDTFIKLYNTPLLTVAAINGHSPAGGCVLSIACDYRVMTKNFKIGGNETQLGLVAPIWFMERISDLIGHRQAELAFNQGKLFSTEEAYKVGLIDEVVDNTAEGLNIAHNIINSYANVPKKARELSKKYVRRQFLEKMINDADDDIESFVNFNSRDDTQKLLKEYKLKLKNK